MARRKKYIPQRKHFFLAVEGRGEQSFIKWLQEICNQHGLHVHLDCEPLYGGGYQAMLQRAKRLRERNSRSKKAVTSILVVDADRSIVHDNWSLQRLKDEAALSHIHVCIQRPNQEGLIYRMFSGCENDIPNTASEAKRKLKLQWHNYQKPVNSRDLSNKFCKDDIVRLANADDDVKSLLAILSLI